MADDQIEEALNSVNWDLVGPGQHALSSARGAAKYVAERLQNSLIESLCDALDIPYGSNDGHGMRYQTLDIVLSDVKSRSDMWRKLLERIQAIDPKWLDALRKGEDLWEGRYPPEVRIAITFHQPPEGNLVAEVWLKEAISKKCTCYVTNRCG